jgi:hypothetical protein
VVGDTDPKRSVFAQAGGAKFNNMKIEAMFQVNYPFSHEELQELIHRGPYAINYTYWLSEYLASPCFITNGISISRRELIQYVANKLGGTHLDQKRNPGKEVDIKYSILDSIRKSIKIADKDAIYFELLSIGQCIASANDIEIFIGRVADILDTE